MTTKNILKTADLRKGLISFCKIHFAFILLLTGQTILYDTSQLITPDQVLKRWIAIACLLIVNGSIWYLASSRSGNALLYKSLLLLMIVSDILLACFSVYSQRGMASRAVFLFVIPIIIAGLLLSRSALFATAILCIAAYSLTAVGYFVNYFNEGYKVELYGEVGFYCATFLIIAALIASILHSRK